MARGSRKDRVWPLAVVRQGTEGYDLGNGIFVNGARESASDRLHRVLAALGEMGCDPHARVSVMPKGGGRVSVFLYIPFREATHFGALGVGVLECGIKDFLHVGRRSGVMARRWCFNRAHQLTLALSQFVVSCIWPMAGEFRASHCGRWPNGRKAVSFRQGCAAAACSSPCCMPHVSASQ